MSWTEMEVQESDRSGNSMFKATKKFISFYCSSEASSENLFLFPGGEAETCGGDAATKKNRLNAAARNLFSTPCSTTAAEVESVEGIYIWLLFTNIFLNILLFRSK